MRTEYLFMLMMLALSALGCYTQHKADTQLEKAHSKYPELTATKAANWYPPKISTVVTERKVTDSFYTPGVTMYVDCDSAVKAAKITPGINTKAVATKCPDVLNLRERIYRDSIASIENTARVEALELHIVALNGKLAEKDAAIGEKDKKIASVTDDKNDWRKYALITWAIIAMFFAAKLFGGYIKTLIRPI